MLGPLLAVLLSAPALPPECDAPELRDVLPLNTLAQKSGSLSVGLDSVATWCFGSSGTWTGGVQPRKGRKADPDAEPLGDCARAIKACEAAKADIADELPRLLSDALADLKVPYLGETYVAKRSGLAERPTLASDCFSRVRSELFTQAQARMDLARLSSQVQHEYGGYRKWLLTESMRCAQLVRAGKKDLLRKGIAVDTPVAPGKSGGPQLPAGPDATTVAVAPDVGARPPPGTTPKPPTPTATAVALPVPALPVMTTLPGATTNTPGSSLPIGGPTTERERAVNGPVLQKWQYFAAQRRSMETDRDFTSGFLASWELRSCRCPRSSPATTVRHLETDAGVDKVLASDAANTRCELCLLDAYAVWKGRAEKQCRLMEQLTEYELGVLERSDDGNGLPPRCLEEARRKRGAMATGPATSPPHTTPPHTTTVIPNPQVVAGPITAGGGQGNQPPPGNQFVITRSDPPPATLPPGKWQTVTTPIADSFARATDYAPVPVREDGRLYVRTFMSSSCTADVQPGPMSARTGDLLLLPPNPPMLQVKMACGGLVEVYWGREARPRVSEIIGRNQPLQLQFRRQ